MYLFSDELGKHQQAPSQRQMKNENVWSFCNLGIWWQQKIPLCSTNVCIRVCMHYAFE